MLRSRGDWRGRPYDPIAKSDHSNSNAPRIDSITPEAVLPGGEVELGGGSLGPVAERRPLAVLDGSLAPVLMSRPRA